MTAATSIIAIAMTMAMMSTTTATAMATTAMARMVRMAMMMVRLPDLEPRAQALGLPDRGRSRRDERVLARPVLVLVQVQAIARRGQVAARPLVASGDETSERLTLRKMMMKLTSGMEAQRRRTKKAMRKI